MGVPFLTLFFFQLGARSTTHASLSGWTHHPQGLFMYRRFDIKKIFDPRCRFARRFSNSARNVFLEHVCGGEAVFFCVHRRTCHDV
jgi:hypothetical protein